MPRIEVLSEALACGIFSICPIRSESEVKLLLLRSKSMVKPKRLAMPKSVSPGAMVYVKLGSELESGGIGSDGIGSGDIGGSALGVISTGRGALRSNAQSLGLALPASVGKVLAGRSGGGNFGSTVARQLLLGTGADMGIGVVTTVGVCGGVALETGGLEVAGTGGLTALETGGLTAFGIGGLTTFGTGGLTALEPKKLASHGISSTVPKPIPLEPSLFKSVNA